jgi:hypothetical protein
VERIVLNQCFVPYIYLAFVACRSPSLPFYKGFGGFNLLNMLLIGGK